MKNFWTPDTLIALIIVLGCIILVALGIDTEIKSILAAAAGYVFGRAYQTKTTG